MYRSLLPTSLEMAEIKARNRLSPEGVKYCNGYCQDYRELIEFTTDMMICNKCRSVLRRAEAKINKGEFTAEQFRENPSIVDVVNSEIVAKRFCNTCKDEKTVDNFSDNKNICKGCRAIRDRKRDSNIDVAIKDIEKLRENMKELRSYLTHIPKGKLMYINSYYKVGRKSSDTKERIIHNMVEHFRKLLNNEKCQSGCGMLARTESGMCLSCDKKTQREVLKKQETGRLTNLEVEDNLDNIVENLTPIEGFDIYKYNKAQIFKMSKKLGVEVRNRQTKGVMLELLNKKLREREEERKQLVEEIGKEIVEVEDLKLNGVTIASRPEDGFVNATALCKAGGKRFYDWNIKEETKALVQALESETGIPVSQLIDVKKGNTKKYTQGSWIHPDLAIQLAQWLSPMFAIQVSRWVREIAISGTVTTGHQKSNQQLLELKRQFDKKCDEHNKLSQKHNGLLMHRSYHKFEKGPVIYIVSDPDSKTKKWKLGVTDDFNSRLSQYRTSIPNVWVNFLMYTYKNSYIEYGILSRFEEKRKPYVNHEWIYNVEVSDIINSIKTLASFICTTCTISDVSEYNQSVIEITEILD